MKSRGFAIETAFLSGSYSKEEEREDSDIEVMLTTKDSMKSDDNVKGKIWALTIKADSRIEPYIISSKRFIEDEDSPF